jgi:hypothetical protein
VESFRAVLKFAVQVFNGRHGKIFGGLIGRAQTDPQLLEAVWAVWFEQRRKIAHEFIREGVSNGELRPDTDGNILIDALYGATYYRLLLPYAPLTDEFIDTVVDYVFNGVSGENLKKPANNQFGLQFQFCC